MTVIGLLFLLSFPIPLNIVNKLDSIGISTDIPLHVVCELPEDLCEPYIIGLYDNGYTLSKRNGSYFIKLGPMEEKDDSIVLYYTISDKKDSVTFKYRRIPDVQIEKAHHRLGILQGILFMTAGYLLFFVIR